MGPCEARIPALRRRRRLIWLLGGLLTLAYLALPDGQDRRYLGSAEEDVEVDDPSRPEIWSISPDEPYPGSTLVIAHSPADQPLTAYAGKRELRVLSRRPTDLVAELPEGLEPGDLKIRLASTLEGSFSERKVRSKPFHVRVRTPDWRAVFRNLLGGGALVMLGIGILSQGVRKAMGLDAARWLVRAARRSGLVLGVGALLGALTQSTTGAAGMLAGVASSRVLPVLPTAIALLGAPLGAALVPLLATGLVEPREGLVAVAVGVLWLGLSSDRRSQALARLVLGTGLVAFGIQVLRLGAEPFLSDAMLWSAAERLRADSLLDLTLCAALGGAVVAGLHGPAPLIVLLLSVSQATGHWDLRTALALLSGTGLGAALAAAIAAPVDPHARALVRLHLCLGTLSTLVAVGTVDLWTALAELALGQGLLSDPWPPAANSSDLGLRLALAFGLSQLAAALVVALLAPPVKRWLESLRVSRAAQPERSQALVAELRAALIRVVDAQQSALGDVVELALSGVRARGHRAEQTLAEGRRRLTSVLAGPVHELPSTQEGASLGGAVYAVLQLQHGLDFLLRETERMIDARVALGEAELDVSTLPWDDEHLLRRLHGLVCEALDAARASLRSGAAPDLELARAREIQINRIEADARGVLLEPARSRALLASHLHVLQVVAAYEVAGNQIYRLAEVLGQAGPASHRPAVSKSMVSEPPALS